MTTPAELAALPSARVFPPANAPKAGNAAPGVQPGSSEEVIARYVIIFGDSGGLFIYAGSPGPGNPPVYSVSNADQDPFGNPISPGIWAGAPGSIQVGIQATPGQAEIFFVPAGTYAADASAGVVQNGGQAILELLGAQTTAAGTPTSDRVGLFLWDHGTSGLPGAHADLQAVYFYTGGTFINLFDGNFAGLAIPACAGITAVEPGTGTDVSTPAVSETWHTVTTDAGWGSLGEPPQYQLLAQTGFVALRGDISHAGTTAQVDINSANPLPAAYRPAATRYYRPPQAADGAGAIEVQPSGVITMRASGFSATQAILDGIYSL